MRQNLLLSVCLAIGVGTGCADEPVDLTPMQTPRADQGTNPPPPDAGPTVQSDMGEPVMLYPDESVFVDTVLPILIAQCGAGCHLGEINLSNNDNPGGNDYEVSEDDIAGSITELLHPSFSVPESPAASEVLVHHGGMYFRTLDEKRAVRDWIADAAIPKGTGGPNPGGPSDLSCSHLPSGDGLGPSGWFEEFENEINPMFVGTVEEPEGYCSGSGCHTMVDQGGDLDFLPVSDPCSARWNFLVSQSFLNLDNLTDSPLLRQPLGEATLDPNVSTHGGREVFKGQDANYTQPRRWIVQLLP